MSIGTDLQTDVTSLLVDLGVSATFTPQTKAGNPATGAVTVTPGTSVSVKVTPPTPFELEKLGDNAVRVADLKTYVQYVQVNSPRVGDTLTLGGVEYKILSVEPVYMGDDIVVFGLDLKE